MGIYVQVSKKSSYSGITSYEFSSDLGSGEFSVNESTGAVDYYKKMPEDKKCIYFSRAARKVINSWKENGKLPEYEVWMS
ncbi:hypothetical protein GKR56_17205 [Providencia alcalifaciens]|uniref:Uncharacterized protein n=1 Tax=Providencia rettgeri TaxID=587 RepID=A0AAE2ZI06_PRORE|nr:MULTISPECIES: hypothetical protein [Providencia]MBW3118884.1 hypothetical protein [Providencia rettgeri]MTC54961.1 hypothetical protein [Providencia alcalifaciens]NHN54116.1 hypothetical protein [Providencia rettgeri]